MGCPCVKESEARPTSTAIHKSTKTKHSNNLRTRFISGAIINDAANIGNKQSVVIFNVFSWAYNTLGDQERLNSKYDRKSVNNPEKITPRFETIHLSLAITQILITIQISRKNSVKSMGKATRGGGAAIK